MITKPNFIGIGGQKCASTWLSECLRSHPDIFMSSPKEIKYFLNHESKGINWYLKFFKDSSSFKVRGEFASNYIYNIETAEKIMQNLGNVKIIAIVRDPVERSLSHIKHLVRDGKLPKTSRPISKNTLKSILKEFPEVLENSKYLTGLQKFEDVFGAESVFVINQASCTNHSNKVLASLWSFLEVDLKQGMEKSGNIISKGITPRYAVLEKIRIKLFSLVRFNAPFLINFARSSGLSERYRAFNKGINMSLSNEASEYIRDECFDDWEGTQSFLSV